MDINQQAQDSDSTDNLNTTKSLHDRTSKAVAVLVVGVLILGLVAVYQQIQLSSLSRTISLQSSQLAHPSATMAVSNFTIVKLNSTARPAMLLVLWNNGSAPASSGSFLIGIYGQNNIFESCYNDTQNFFPIYSNESTMLLSRLNCGDIGNSVVLTATVNFLTSRGSITRVFSARTTISQSKFVYPSTIVINQIGIQTVVIPEIISGSTVYAWHLTVTNYSPTPITSVTATLGPTGNTIAEDSGCVLIPIGKNIYGVSKITPLQPRFSCQDDNNANPGRGPFTLGEQLVVVVKVTYSNGTLSSASTTATVEPPYVLFQ